MSVLNDIEKALSSVDIPIGLGIYPNETNCGKVVFDSSDSKPKIFMGGMVANVESFRVVVKGIDYKQLEQMCDTIKIALQNAGFVQVGGYNDVEPEQGETYLQLAVSFRTV